MMVRLLFSPLEAVSEVTNSFLDLLENRVRESGQSALVGDAFLQLALRLGTYIKFAETFPQALSALTDAQRKSPALVAFLERTEKSPHCGLRTLRSFLEMPLERPQCYIAFLTEYVGSTSEGHPDKRELSEALEMIKTGSASIRKHDASDLEKIIAIEQRLKGHFETLVAPGRTFVVEARATLLQIGDQPLDAPFEVIVFLFSDLLVIAKVSKHDRVKMLDRMPLSEVIVGNVDEPSSLSSASPPSAASSSLPMPTSATSFKIQRCTVGSTLKSGYVMSASSIRDQKAIVDAILQTQTTAAALKKK